MGEAMRSDGAPAPGDAISGAIARLASALDRLDAASLRHADGDRARATLESELALMREDRHQLARTLDEEKAARLAAEAGLDAIAPRVDRAIASIRSALAHS